MIDWERVAILREEVGEEGFSLIVDAFLDEVGEAVARLGWIAAPDLEAELHFLKGGALNLGFSDLAELCGEGEQLAAQGHAEEVDRASIVTLYNMSRAGFRFGLAGSMAS